MIFSVVCPVYNGEKYLSEAIESVLFQTLEDWELIIVDDFSADQSNLIANKYSKKDSRIKVIRNNANQGQFFSRMKGIRNSLGEAVVFLDSDDKLEFNCLEILKNYFEENQNIGCIVYNCGQFSEDNLPIQNIDSINKKTLIDSSTDFYRAVFVKKTIPTVWRYCFKKDSLEKIINLNLSCNTRLGEDMYFLTVSTLNVSNALLVNDIIYKYRLNKNSVCHTLTSDKAFDRFCSNEASYCYVGATSPNVLEDLPYRVANIISWSIAKYLELGSLEDSHQLFKKRCFEIKKSFIWKRIVKKHKFESKYPNLLLICFKYGLLFFIKYIVRKYKKQ